MEFTKDNTANTFIPETDRAVPVERPEAPKPGDSSKEAASKRQALREWYQNRRQTLRLRLKMRADKKTPPLNAEQGSFEVMGRWAINQALVHDNDPSHRRKRRQYLMRRWRTFMRQTFHPGSV